MSLRTESGQFLLRKIFFNVPFLSAFSVRFVPRIACFVSTYFLTSANALCSAILSLLECCNQWGQPSSHMYGLVEHDVFNDGIQFINLSNERCRDDMLDGCFKARARKHGRFVTHDSVSRDALDVPARAHRVSDEHDMPHIHIKALILDHFENFIDNGLAGGLAAEDNAGA